VNHRPGLRRQRPPAVGQWRSRQRAGRDRNEIEEFRNPQVREGLSPRAARRPVLLEDDLQGPVASAPGLQAERLLLPRPMTGRRDGGSNRISAAAPSRSVGQLGPGRHPAGGGTSLCDGNRIAPPNHTLGQDRGVDADRATALLGQVLEDPAVLCARVRVWDGQQVRQYLDALRTNTVSKTAAGGWTIYRWGWQFTGSEGLDEAYVPIFGAFGAAWDDGMVAHWSANPSACSGRRWMRRL
jgi:hypothetical protein